MMLLFSAWVRYKIVIGSFHHFKCVFFMLKPSLDNTTEYSNCTNGEVRLVGGDTVNEGNVQICHRNALGSICDDSCNTNDATASIVL